MNEELYDGMSLEDYINSLVGFCGCGSPNVAYKLLFNVLLVFKKRTEDYSETRDKSWKESYSKIEKLLKYHSDDLEDNENGLYWTYLYFLDDKGLTEHGGSVNGCWLTDKGYEVLDLLKKYLKINE